VLRALAASLWAALVVLARRAVGIRRAPGMRLAIELLVNVQRAALTALLYLDPAVVRGLTRGGLLTRALALRVRARRMTLGGVPVECVEPVGREPERAVFYIHGGGYVFGSTDSHREIVSRLADEACARVWSVEYRLAPEHPWPAAIEDVEAAWRGLVESGGEPARTVVAGDSAGGALTLALLQRLRDSGRTQPAGAVPISPAVNTLDWGKSFDTNAATDYITREMAEHWVGDLARVADRRDPLISPAFADLRGLPPLLVHAGAGEALVDQIDAFVAKARAAGLDVEYHRREGMFHVWHLFARFLHEARESTAEMAAWIRSRTPLPSRSGA
jgi:acetyl esterase/lipase